MIGRVGFHESFQLSLDFLKPSHSKIFAKNHNFIYAHTFTAMNQEKISYFTARYSALDSDELGDLVLRRSDLDDEAGIALDKVLAEKGININEVLVAEPKSPEKTEIQLQEENAHETKISRKLWRSWLSLLCEIEFINIGLILADLYIRRQPLGAILNVVITVGMGYIGYQIGHSVTKNICSNGEVSIAVKKKSLWILFFSMLPIYFGIRLIGGKFFQ